MKKLLALLVLVVGCNVQAPTPEPIADEFFEAEAPVSDVLTSPAASAVKASKDEPATDPLSEPIAVSDVMTSYLSFVDDGDGNAATFALDLHVDGLENHPDGFSSFQIYDIEIPGCTVLIGAEDGTMLGSDAYPFISHFVIAKRRFGGYGATPYSIKESGTLYRLFFVGGCNSGSIVLKDYFFSKVCTAPAGNATSCKLPMEPEVVKYDF